MHDAALRIRTGGRFTRRLSAMLPQLCPIGSQQGKERDLGKARGGWLSDAAESWPAAVARTPSGVGIAEHDSESEQRWPAALPAVAESFV